MLLDDGRTERVMLAQHSGLEAFEDAVTAYRLLGPMINGCSWMELRPHTSRKHQVPAPFSFIKRVHFLNCGKMHFNILVVVPVKSSGSVRDA